MNPLLLTFVLLLARSQQSYAGPTALVPREDNCQYDHYTQKIDHFGRHNGTFQQKYNLVTDYYEPGGPIFWAQGSEQHFLPCLVSDMASISGSTQ